MSLEGCSHGPISEGFGPGCKQCAEEHSASTLKAAQKWALVKFVCALETRKAEDAALATEANGWRSRSVHDLYDDVLVTLNDLARGLLDPNVYLEREREAALRGESW